MVRFKPTRNANIGRQTAKALSKEKALANMKYPRVWRSVFSVWLLRSHELKQIDNFNIYVYILNISASIVVCAMRINILPDRARYLDDRNRLNLTRVGILFCIPAGAMT